MFKEWQSSRGERSDDGVGLQPLSTALESVQQDRHVSVVLGPVTSTAVTDENNESGSHKIDIEPVVNNESGSGERDSLRCAVNLQAPVFNDCTVTFAVKK